MGLLGPNGSGKSTLLRAISGQIPVTTGGVHLLGIDLAREPEAAKRIFGYAVDPPDLPATLTGTQYLQMISSIRGCAAKDWFRADLIELLALGQWLEQRIGEYSYGTRMKLSLAAALLGNPPLIMLDESLNGLDPVIAWRVKRLLVEMVRTGRHAVLLSTHVLETVESLCSSAILLTDGKISARWDSEALQQARQHAGGFEASVMTALGEVAPHGEAGAG
jgi:ABC-2 type transport system ATP-binding protein